MGTSLVVTGALEEGVTEGVDEGVTLGEAEEDEEELLVVFVETQSESLEMPNWVESGGIGC